MNKHETNDYDINEHNGNNNAEDHNNKCTAWLKFQRIVLQSEGHLPWQRRHCSVRQACSNAIQSYSRKAVLQSMLLLHLALLQSMLRRHLRRLRLHRPRTTAAPEALSW